MTVKQFIQSLNEKNQSLQSDIDFKWSNKDIKYTNSILSHYLNTDTIVDMLIQNGYSIICISYGYQSFHDLILFDIIKFKHLKHISYEKLDSYSDDILYRMRNCLSYFDMLDDETQSDISDILYDRYCARCFEGYGC